MIAKLPKGTRIPRAFTVLELLLVLVLIGVLATLLLPTVEKVREKADAVACIANLRGIGVALQAAISDNDNSLPYIEIDSDNPIYNAEDIERIGETPKSLLEAFTPYGLTERHFRCPADVKTVNYFAEYGTSYQWRPLVDGEQAQAPLIYRRRGVISVPPSRVTIMFDMAPVHPRPDRQNRLFLDGVVNRPRGR